MSNHDWEVAADGVIQCTKCWKYVSPGGKRASAMQRSIHAPTVRDVATRSVPVIWRPSLNYSCTRSMEQLPVLVDGTSWWCKTLEDALHYVESDMDESGRGDPDVPLMKSESYAANTDARTNGRGVL